MSSGAAEWAPVALWAAVVASGAYHGLNPGMGWPLAVSAGLMERRGKALAVALGYLALGHLLAVLAVLLPFALLSMLLSWRWHIQLGAGLLVLGFGVMLLLWRRHPRALARIPPAQLGLWSFVVAVAHGAGLMLVPIYLGLCRPAGRELVDPATLSLGDMGVGTAVGVAIAHTLAVLTAGGAMAWLVYRHLGLRFLAQSWFNLEVVWAASLILIGGVSIVAVLADWH